MKKVLFVLALLFSIISLEAQNIFSDSIQVSLLTCGQGPDAYERFGHTAVRIKDQKRNNRDIVFHYGVFSFKTPNFVWRFVKGETDYQLGAVETSYFLKEYSDRGLLMYEQTLDLDSAQAAKVAQMLIENYAPQNRVYRYNYFYDNCATRPFHLINKACDNQIAYDEQWVKPITYREMVRNMTHPGTWLDFGITLAIGMGADKPLGLNQQIFLPDYLATAYDNATLDGRTLVVKTDTLMTTDIKVQSVIDEKPSIFDPLPVMICLLLAAVLLLASRIRQGNSNSAGTLTEGYSKKTSAIMSNIFDTVFLLGTGVAASILWMLLLVSEHPTVNENLNCLWLWPTNLIFCPLIWLKLPQKVHRIYFLLIFAALVTFFACVSNGLQDTSPAIMVLAATLMIRSIERAFFNQ